MHLALVIFTLIVIGFWRWQWREAVSCGVYHLAQLVLPVLAFGCLAIAVFSMATEGLMLGVPIHGGWVARCVVGGITCASLGHLVCLCYQGWQCSQRLQQLGLVDFCGAQARLLPIDLPFAAQVGFWRSQLVVSAGLLGQLSPAQLQAVFYHEQAHALNHDCFWFLGLGWLRQITSWLPYTGAIWQKLLLERELQADRYACRFVEPLTLAEALVQVVSYRGSELSPLAQAGGSDRLEVRIEQLLCLPEDADLEIRQPDFSWLYVLLVLLSAALPLGWIPLHQI